ncbi:hypothetical protein HW090_02260 [Pseudomonas sp. ABC1]|uniref:ATP-binding protein n=1 Tax=Pseudomonas sp. ABC1 TaxID=2748080 RepID=UPI0015C30C43|nr:ATP-binding protein [Pseudomonas sp. ABC1]QLF92091.1 hypothetical protein HW090_02260 [Pseudomonas sp. ABC1]
MTQKIMNREATKKDLLHYLNDAMVPVIALKGLWGTGKSYLWGEVKDEFPPVDGNDHLYVSCFGLESVDQIKTALFQNSLGKAEKAVGGIQKYSGFAIDALEKIMARVQPVGEGAATVLGNLGGLVQSALIDKVLYSRLVVLDDIERRGDALKIDALLGFIDLLKRNNCKVLLILNEKPLEDAYASDWRTLKEKCVDREITLLTSAEEAADIGLCANLKYRDAVMRTLVRLSVTNIRVIQRVGRIVETVFEDVADPHGSVEHSFLPSTVLMIALNFNAIPNGPDISVLMSEWSTWCVKPNFFGPENKGMSDAVAFATNEGLTRDREFLALIIQHILTGHRLRDKFEELFQQRNKKDAHSQAENAAVSYIENTYLDPWMSDEAFIRQACMNKEAWISLSADKVSAIVTDLEKRGANTLASEIANAWCKHWSNSPSLWCSHLFPLDSFHPVIKEALVAGNRQLSASPSLLDAVLKIASGGWSPSDTDAVNKVSIKEACDVILELNKENFGTFIHFYRKEIKSPLLDGSGQAVFSTGVSLFLEAARQITRENTRPRLTELLRMHLGEVLDISPDVSEQKSDSNLTGTS